VKFVINKRRNERKFHEKKITLSFDHQCRVSYRIMDKKLVVYPVGKYDRGGV